MSWLGDLCFRRYTLHIYSCRPTEGRGAAARGVLLRYETGVRYVVGLNWFWLCIRNSVLDFYLDIPSACLTRGISGSAVPLSGLYFTISIILCNVCMICNILFLSSIYDCLLLEYYGMLIGANSTLISPRGGFACRDSSAQRVSGRGLVQALGLYIKSGPLSLGVRPWGLTF